MSQEIYERIRGNPKFQAIISKRNKFSVVMISLILVVYYGYIVLIAFGKALLATKISAGSVTSIGIPLGLGVILFTIVLTWVYVARANSEFDSEAEAIIKESRQ